MAEGPSTPEEEIVKSKSPSKEFGVSSVRDVLGLMNKDKEAKTVDQGEMDLEEFSKRMKAAEEMKQKLTGTENTTGQTPPNSPNQGPKK